MEIPPGKLQCSKSYTTIIKFIKVIIAENSVSSDALNALGGFLIRWRPLVAVCGNMSVSVKHLKSPQRNVYFIKEHHVHRRSVDLSCAKSCFIPSVCSGTAHIEVVW